MAEEGSSAKVYTLEDLVFLLFFLLVVSHMLGRIPLFLEEQFGVRLGQQELGLASAGLDRATPLGTPVTVVNGAPFAERAGGPPNSSLLPGTETTLEDGPKTIGLKRYWYVRDPLTGQGGWVEERYLVKSGASGFDAATRAGARVRSVIDVLLWSEPAGAVQAGIMAAGTLGTLREGPVLERGGRWWFVDQDDSREDGWVPESGLALGAEPTFRRNMQVVARYSTDLFERAGGGQTIGVLAEDESGRVIEGPVEVGGAAWWYVTSRSGQAGWVPESALTEGGVRGWLRGVLFIFAVVASLLTVVLLAGLLYVTFRTNQIRAKEARRIRDAIPKRMDVLRNERWEQVMRNVSSENPNDWRLAIIEADIMLDELVTKMGYQGNTLGEKLKQVTRGDLRSLDSAWEAHKVRNQIAHAGSDFILSGREARRVIELYGEVFSEVRYI